MIRSFENRAEQKISGFQSPAADYLEGRLNITDRLVIDPHSTFYFQMKGSAMNSFGILDEDLLIIDRSLSAEFGAVVIAFISGSFTCRIYVEENNQRILKNDQDRISEADDDSIQIWGVVTSICRNVLPKKLRVGRYSHVCTL